MELPRRIGRYVLEEPLGRGGMAEVFRARLDDGGFEKAVCMKRVLPQLAGQPGFLDMFRDEAQLAARLTHPHLVQALDLVSAERTLWLVLELVEGTTLKRVLEALRMAGERMSITQALHVTTCISRGLHHAHTAMSPRGEPLAVVHRDVSPDNVLLGVAGDVKLGDFGVARASERLAARTATGAIKGKPGYMAPEQILGEPSDHRVDQFAMASVLWEMLAGRPVFEGKTEMDLAEAVVSCIVPPLPTHVPASVEAVVNRALCRDPAQRFSSMATFEAAVAKELYARVRAPADVDVHGLVDRALQESNVTMRIARAPARDTALNIRTPTSSEELDADDKTATMSPDFSEMTSRVEISKPLEPTAPIAPSPRRPQGKPEPVAVRPLHRRLWIVFGATVAAGAVAASVTAAVVARSFPKGRPGPTPSSPSTSIVQVPVPPSSRAPSSLEGAVPAQERPAPLERTPPPAAAAAAEAADADDDRAAAADADRAAAAVAEAASERAASESAARRKRAAGELAAARSALLGGRVTEAVTSLKAIVANDPPNAEAHRMLGVAYGKLRDPRRAAAHYRMYLGLRPDAPDADAVRAALGQQALP